MIVSYFGETRRGRKFFLILLDRVRSLYILQTEYILYIYSSIIHIYTYIYIYIYI